MAEKPMQSAPLLYKINDEWTISLNNIERIHIDDDSVTFFLTATALSFSYKTGVAEKVVTKDELAKIKNQAHNLIKYFHVEF